MNVICPHLLIAWIQKGFREQRQKSPRWPCCPSSRKCFWDTVRTLMAHVKVDKLSRGPGNGMLRLARDFRIEFSTSLTSFSVLAIARCPSNPIQSIEVLLANWTTRIRTSPHSPRSEFVIGRNLVAIVKRFVQLRIMCNVTDVLVGTNNTLTDLPCYR